MISMREDMWAMIPAYEPDAVCVTTCQVLNSKGQLVMGAGIAKQAKQRFPSLPALWGEALLKKPGLTTTYDLADYALVSFPTKEHFRNNSIPELIAKSARALVKKADKEGWGVVFLPRPGCSNGKLEWCDVRPILQDAGLDNRFVIFSR